MGSFQTERRGLDFSGMLTTFSCVKLGNWGLVFLSSREARQALACICLLFSRISALLLLPKSLKLDEVLAGAFSL